VSLVYFSQNRLRPPGTGPMGRIAFRPVSDHPFLNVRTYVRHRGVVGIYFLAEWIPHRLNCWLGPRTYGLPYRLGSMEAEVTGPTGVGRVTVCEAGTDAKLSLSWPVQPAPLAECLPGSLDAFLLERYTAHTGRHGILRRFDVAHAPWQVRRLDWVRGQTGLLEENFPWFAAAQLVCGHATPGFTDVRMGFPHRC